MKDHSITIPVDAEMAQIYNSLSKKDKQRYGLIVYLRLKEVVKESRSLDEIIEDLSFKAQKRGLTPEILHSILSET